MMHQLHTKRVQTRRRDTLRYCSGLSWECKKKKPMKAHNRSTHSGASVHAQTPLEGHQLPQQLMPETEAPLLYWLSPHIPPPSARRKEKKSRPTYAMSLTTSTARQSQRRTGPF